MGQRGTGLAGERVLRTQCAAAAGSRRCGQSRSLRQVAAARSSRCRPRLFPRCGRGRERSVSRGAGASPATAHWAAVGHPTKVRSSPRASNSPPFRLILNYSCSDCLSCPLSGPVSCVCPVGASSRPTWSCRPAHPQRPGPRVDLQAAAAAGNLARVFRPRCPPAAMIGRDFFGCCFAEARGVAVGRRARRRPGVP